MVLKEGEGCLSVRWLYGKVKRHTNVTIKYYDHTGKLHVRGAGGLLAHIFQHEIDHLDGVLFIDKALYVSKFLRHATLVLTKSQLCEISAAAECAMIYVICTI